MNDRAARAYGVSAVRTKLAAFAVSGFLAGVAGCLLVVLQQAYSENTYAPAESLGVFTAAAVGGLGSTLGAVLGALFLQGGRWFLPSTWQLLPTAIGVLAVLMIWPGGLADLLLRARDALARRLAVHRGIDAPSLTGRTPEAGLDDGDTPSRVDGRLEAGAHALQNASSGGPGGPGGPAVTGGAGGAAP
jgi:branched-chain amino acid transport system permease protein